jgi:hypothetical protein
MISSSLKNILKIVAENFRVSKKCVPLGVVGKILMNRI